MGVEQNSPSNRIPGELSLADLLGFVDRHWRAVAIGSAIAVLVGILLRVFVFQTPFVSRATLAVLPPPVRSELAQITIPVQGYQQLLESDAVLAKTKQILVDEGSLDSTARLTVGQNVASQIFVRRRDGTLLAPLLEIRANAGSPEVAAAIANTWAQVFLQQVKQITDSSVGGAVAFVEEQFSQTREDLMASEAVLLEREKEFLEIYEEAANKWDRRVSAYQRGTTDRVAQHQTETRVLIESYVERFLGDADASWVEDRSVTGTLARLAAARIQLAQAVPVRDLEKSISDEALWNSVVLRGLEADLATLENQSLVTQEVNANYDLLILRALEVESELRGMISKTGAGSRYVVDLEKWQTERQAGLLKLIEQSSTELAILRRSKAKELDHISRETQLDLEGIRREVRQLRALDDRLTKNFNEAVLARAQESFEEVRVLAIAPPGTASGKKLLLVAAVSAFFGGFLGLFTSVYRDWRRGAPDAA